MTPVVGTSLTYHISSYDDFATWTAGILFAVFAFMSWARFRDTTYQFWATTRSVSTSVAFLLLSVTTFLVRDGKLSGHASFVLFWATTISAVGTTLWALLLWDRDKTEHKRFAACGITTVVLSLCALAASFWIYSDAAGSHHELTVRIDVALWWLLFAIGGFALVTGFLGVEVIMARTIKPLGPRTNTDRTGEQAQQE